MTKRIITFLVAVILCFSMGIFAFAEGENGLPETDRTIPATRLLPLVVDDADFIDDSAEKALIADLEAYAQENQVEIAIVTVLSLGDSATIEAFADDTFDYYGYGYGEGKDGILIALCPSYFGTEYNSIHISTHGSVEQAITPSDVDTITSNYGDDLRNGKFETTVEFCKTCIDEHLHPSVAWYWIPGSLLIGFIIAYLVTKAKTANLKSVKNQVNADSYVVPNSLMLSQSYDNFLFSNVSKTPKQTSSSSSSGGSHTSSSGQSHGGGGGRL